MIRKRGHGRPKDERLVGNALREQLRAEQDNRCFWCNAEMEDAAWGYPRPPLAVTLDHVEPRAAGGSLSADNCVAACHGCNDRRSKEFNQARSAIARKIHKAVKGLSAAEIAERLGRVAREIAA